MSDSTTTTVALAARLSKHLAAAATCCVVTISQAGIVHWSDANLIVPATIDGLYINVEARTTGSAGSVVAGWDINPYSATSLTWFNATGTGMMRFPGVTTGSAGSLTSGTFVGPTGSFGSGAVVIGSAAGNWQLNASNYFGFRFVAADGITKYGWGRFVIGASIFGADRLIAEIAFDDSGAAIAVGNTGCVTWYRDLDGDGVGLTADGTAQSCSGQLAGYALTDGDNCPSIANPNQADANANGIGDVCEFARGDLNLDGVVNASDVPLFFNAWGSGAGSPADMNLDGTVNAADFSILLGNWGHSCVSHSRAPTNDSDRLPQAVRSPLWTTQCSPRSTLPAVSPSPALRSAPSRAPPSRSQFTRRRLSMWSRRRRPPTRDRT